MTLAVTAPRFMMGATAPLVDEPVSAGLVGLQPSRLVRIRAAALDANGARFSSWACYRADQDGTAQPARHDALTGTYEGVDPFGLWWSMRGEPGAVLGDGLPPLTTSLTAEVDGESVAEVNFQRLRLGHGVEVSPVDDPDLAGKLFAPPAGHGPGLVILGGSGGGFDWSEEAAALLASRGFVALALAYFGLPPAPPSLQEVALEYVGKAISWLLGTMTVSGKRVGVVGCSRGGELALLAGSTFPDVGAVVGYVPSAVVWNGLGTAEAARRSAWASGGAPLPFLYPVGVPVSASTRRVPRVMLSSFERALADEQPVDAATIPVERIRGPLLLISAGRDLLWPSRTLCELAMSRLARACHGFPSRHLCYRTAGHQLSTLPGLPAPPVVRIHPRDGRSYSLGGSREANSAAAVDAWPRILRFLDRALGPGALPRNPS